MGGGYRADRVAEMVHRELAERLRTEVKDPLVETVSITHVQVTRDLSRAVVSWLPLGGQPTPELQEALDAAGRALRGPIGRALRLRHAPEIVFEPDTHTEEAFRVSGLLARLRRERGDEPSDGEAEEPSDGEGEEPGEALDDPPDDPSDDDGETP